MTVQRCAGILLHPTSLPSRFEVGDLGPSADRFLSWLADAGQRVWQVLPLGPPGYGASPYDALSAFAGNPLLISPDRLREDQMIDSIDLCQPSEPDHVDYVAVARWKTELLRKSWAYVLASRSDVVDELTSFSREHAAWLEDWSLFAALNVHYGGGLWTDWPSRIARRYDRALARARKKFAEEMRFHSYVQYLFWNQWHRVRLEARRRDIRIVGDIPMYVAHHSADVWSRPELFVLDRERHPIAVAGVPPDYFSETGQRWGNPLYRWEVLEETGFSWWIERLRTVLELVDGARLDHFRAFAEYFAIPAEEPTAVRGLWLPGPGMRFFDAVRESLGTVPLIAEDLGTITEDVHQLRRAVGIPGMRVLQFAFSEDDSTHLPHNYDRDTVVYTGTHDNDTTRGWSENLSEPERTRLERLIGTGDEPISHRLILAAYESVGDMAIVPMQDVLDLGSEARMNTPGRSDGNWSWRLRESQLRSADAERLRRAAESTGR